MVVGVVFGDSCCCLMRFILFRKENYSLDKGKNEMKTVLIIMAICSVAFTIFFWDKIVEVWKYYRNNPLKEKDTKMKIEDEAEHTYKIRTGREIKNNIYHVLFGAALAFVMVPVYGFWIMVLSIGVFGIARELLQYWRKKKQPLYIQIIDAAGFFVGGGLWYAIREIFNINADIL